MMSTSRDYAFQATIKSSYDDTLEKLGAALKEEGFGILTSLNMQAILKEKLGAAFRRYSILGACNPPLAQRALERDLDAGLILPCSIVVYEEEGDTVVSIANPLAFVSLLDNAELEPIAEEATSKLQRVLHAVEERTT
jgi:uncharacterized protein (DUF302 family)